MLQLGDVAPDFEIPVLRAPEARDTLAISSVAKRGLEELKERLWKLVAEVKTADTESEQESGRHGF